MKTQLTSEHDVPLVSNAVSWRRTVAGYVNVCHPLWSWFAVFGALQIGDVLTTILAFKLGAHELNPVTAFVFQRVGIIVGMTLKLAVAAIIIVNTAAAYPASPKWARREIVMFCVIMAWIVAMNLGQSILLATR